MERAADRFDAVVAPAAAWTSRFFFASIGFVVPAGRLVSGPAVLYGALLSAVACLAKVVTGVFYEPAPWRVGWAMVGRGELGFVMAVETYKRGKTSDLALSMTVWALLVATLLSPVVLRRLLPAAEAAAPSSKRDVVVADLLPAAEAAPPSSKRDVVVAADDVAVDEGC